MFGASFSPPWLSDKIPSKYRPKLQFTTEASRRSCGQITPPPDPRAVRRSNSGSLSALSSWSQLMGLAFEQSSLLQRNPRR